MLEWLSSYLTCRTQFVEILQARSTLKNITKGVPQGSILGPLLFVIYINDMHKCTNLRLVHYADDSTAYKTLDSLNSISEVNTELSKISEWLCANRLSLNVTKSYFSICY